MSWMSALSGWQWAILLATPPAVLLLYFLKLRRTSVVVPSTFLWQRTIEDLHVNSIWQRLRQSLLLYLQLLFLAALIFACLRPGFTGSQQTGQRSIFLVDNSASMQATDESPSRLDVAKAKVRQQIESMQSGDVGMILAFSDRADVKQGFTGDRRKLIGALDSIKPTNRTTDLTEALRAAAGLANPGRVSFDDVNDVQVADALPAKVFILSDGRFPSISDFDLGNLTAEYVAIGKATSDNVGIVAFTTQRNEEKPDEVEAFGRILNESAESVQVIASLYINDEFVDASTIDLPAGEEVGVNFQLTSFENGKMRLELDREDTLPIDNVAYAALRPATQLNLLLITPGNSALETSLSTGRLSQLASLRVEPESYLEDPEYAKLEAAGQFDLILFDQCVPKTMPNANTFFIGVQPTIEGWSFGQTQGPVFIADWDRSHPMMQYIEMGSVQIVEGFSIKPPDSGSVLMTADLGPVMALAPRGPYQDAVLGFQLVRTKDGANEVNTDWAIKRSFPVFIYSVVEYLGGGITTAAATSVLPGQPIGLTLSNRYENFNILSPEGTRSSVSREGQSQLVFTQTETPGIYQVLAEDNENPVETFAVNLFSTSESSIAANQDLQLGGEAVKVSEGSLIGRQEYWRWILLIAFLVLLAEWIIYNRRIFV